MPNSINIEFLLEFDSHSSSENFSDSVAKGYFLFKMTISEISLIQLNLTTHAFNNEGKMEFNKYIPKIIIKSKGDRIINEFSYGDTKEIKPGEYFIQWNYNGNNNIAPPNEVLFWIPFKGKVDVEFIGRYNNSIINKKKSIENLRDNSKLKIKKSVYKLSQKLGEFYERKARMENVIRQKLKVETNEDLEDRGYSLEYKENENIAFSFVINENDIKESSILSQNIDCPEFFFEGTHSRYERIIGDGKIYQFKNNKEVKEVYRGKINHNLFPQFIQEDDKNELIVEVESRRFQLSQEINENEDQMTLNIRRKGPFKGQLKLKSHAHYLTNCITPYRKGYLCDRCDRFFNNRIETFYCSKCDYDYCNNNCNYKKNKENGERRAHYYPEFQYKSFQHKHPLICVYLLKRDSYLKCFSCLKNISQDEKLYYCTECDFRLCEKCQINEARGKPWQFHTCWHEHPLTFCKSKTKKKDKTKVQISIYDLIKYNTPEGPEFKEFNNPSDIELFFFCNHCGIGYSKEKDYFYCTACDFYICLKCNIDYFFYKGREKKNEINVYMGNKIVYPVQCKLFFEDNNNEQIVKCKKCKIDLNLDDWNYYCSNCNSVFCNNCYVFHKIIFQNNILKFDGFFDNNNNIKNGFGISYKNNNDINYSGNWIDGHFRLVEKTIPHSHQFIENDFDNTIQCDICLKLCDSFDAGLSCRDCNIDICDKCKIKINLKLIKAPIIHEHNLEIKRCQSSVKCNFCENKKTGIFFSCDICNNQNWYNRLLGINNFYCCIKCFIGKFN